MDANPRPRLRSQQQSAGLTDPHNVSSAPYGAGPLGRLGSCRADSIPSPGPHDPRQSTALLYRGPEIVGGKEIRVVGDLTPLCQCRDGQLAYAPAVPSNATCGELQK